MNVDLIQDATLEDIKNGYIYDDLLKTYRCIICDSVFEEGEIFPIGNRLYEAKKAVLIHIKEVHGTVFDFLLQADKKYTSLTETQKELLHSFYNGMSDKDIANKNGTSPATVRYQRFSMREKAKQAKIYLALMELLEEQLSKQDSKDDKLVPIHSGARMVDERHLSTYEDTEKVLKAYFISDSPLVLKEFPAKEKKKIIVLRKITEQFDPETRYTEKDLNKILKLVFADYVTIRRYLIEYGFMDRTTDCKEYWIKK